MKIRLLATGEVHSIPKMEDTLLNQLFGKGNFEVLEVGTSSKLDSEAKLQRLGLSEEDREKYLKGLELLQKGMDLWDSIDCKYQGTKVQVGRGFYFQNPDKVPANLIKK